MKQHIFLIAIASLSLFSCSNDQKKSAHDHGHEHNSNEGKVQLSSAQFKALEVKVGQLTTRDMGESVEVNGRLEVPPQNEATVTAIIGANINSIQVIEGAKVNRGQALAYLSHPDLIKVQTDYLNNWSQLEYAEQDFERQEKLYEENVSSGREFQRAKAEYLTKKGMVKGLESQLKLMGLSVEKIREGHIYEIVPVVCPIDGYVRKVEVKTGQFVQPQTEMFEVVNIEHIHADFMVFEKDMHKVEEDQKVEFTVSSMPDEVLMARIHSVGKAFEENPKAIHLHAEIENKKGLLLPGMYARGRILVNTKEVQVVPEEAIVAEDDRHYIFLATEGQDHGNAVWWFTPIKVARGNSLDGWVEVNPFMEINKNQKIALSHAYTLMADLKKEEAEHSH
ncbi:MAG: efflux RND transporter periplasmic adaptor subunit [Schleiferiaceae bacterium]|jgi:cobalt-zinc-cadmium efflux system membrane fusion protein|nr:efflux RND transporter periplasmic adaptor subunit [Schleiferiaceae bacterium]